MSSSEVDKHRVASVKFEPTPALVPFTASVAQKGERVPVSANVGGISLTLVAILHWGKGETEGERGPSQCSTESEFQSPTDVAQKKILLQEPQFCLMKIDPDKAD